MHLRVGVFLLQKYPEREKRRSSSKNCEVRTMNIVGLSGRATRDPEVRYTAGNESMCVARFTLAVRRKFVKDGEDTADYINCVAFRRTAEWIERNVKKGTRVEIKGFITTGSYTNRDGQKVYTTEIHVEDIEFGESKQASELSSAGNYQNNEGGNNGGFVNCSRGTYGGANQGNPNNAANQQAGPRAQETGNGYNEIPMEANRGFNGYYGRG